jgi:phosphatidate cytidylyltransferase
MKAISKELRDRLLYAFAAAAVALFVIFALGPTAVFLVALACGLQGWKEYSRMMGIRERPIFHRFGYAYLCAVFLYIHFLNKNLEFSWVCSLWASGFCLLFLDHRISKYQALVGDLKLLPVAPDKDWMVLNRFSFGILYVFMIFGFVGPIAAKGVIGTELLVLGFTVVFLGDTGAYFVGKAKGRRKLWPEISPNKTVEGSMGGLLGSVLGAILVWGLFYLIQGPKNSIPLGPCLLVGVLGAVLGQAGDLLESLMKRAAGTKDSGAFLPGHGGLLDRCDGLAFVFPLIYYAF